MAFSFRQATPVAVLLIFCLTSVLADAGQSLGSAYEPRDGGTVDPSKSLGEAYEPYDFYSVKDKSLGEAYEPYDYPPEQGPDPRPSGSSGGGGDDGGGGGGGGGGSLISVFLALILQPLLDLIASLNIG